MSGDSSPAAGRADHLAALLVAYLAAVAPAWDVDPAGEELQLVLRTPDGTEVATAGLEARHLRALLFDLREGFERRGRGEARTRRRQGMTALIVEARLAGEDIGNVMAFCLHAAAAWRDKPASWLVRAWPGSPEANVVVRWAEFGGVAPRWSGRDRLVDLFCVMGSAGDDGGQVVSDALGYAARQLAAHEPRAVPPIGALQALCSGSGWAREMWAMARPLNLDDPWEPGQ